MSVEHGYGKIVTSGMVLCLNAADRNSYPGSGTTWNDLSGKNNNAILYNAPTFSGVNGGVLGFDGLNDYVAVSNSNNFAWTPSGIGMNNMTLDIWVQTSDGAGNILSKPWNGGGEYNYQIVSYLLVLNNGNQSNQMNYSSVATGIWTNLVILLSSTQFGAYINGIQNVALTNHGITNNTPTGANSALPLSIMTVYPYGEGWAGNTSHAIQGNVSSLRIYNRILTSTEILQNYNATKTRFGL